MVALVVPTSPWLWFSIKMIGAKCGEGASENTSDGLARRGTTPTEYEYIVAEPYGTSNDLIGDISSY